jgi:hypothetical protein
MIRPVRVPLDDLIAEFAEINVWPHEMSAWMALAGHGVLSRCGRGSAGRCGCSSAPQRGVAGGPKRGHESIGARPK